MMTCSIKNIQFVYCLVESGKLDLVLFFSALAFVMDSSPGSGGIGKIARNFVFALSVSHLLPGVGDILHAHSGIP